MIAEDTRSAAHPAAGLDATDLAARQLIAGALADALCEPLHLPAAHGTLPTEVVRAAWSVVAAAHADVGRASLSLRERAPGGVGDAEVSALNSWLSLPIAERELAYRAVFGLVFSKHCPPYETEYCETRDTFHRSQHMADIGGFFRAFQLRPGSGGSGRVPERPDHASLLLGFVSFLLKALSPDPNRSDNPERTEVISSALRSFVGDHIAWWMPTFAGRLEQRADRLAGETDDFALRAALQHLSGVARLLAAWVASERLSAGVEPVRRLIDPSLALAEQDQADECDDSCGECSSQGHVPRSTPAGDGKPPPGAPI